ncbi:calcium-binding protein 2-like [Manis pentadactyla]|uniref:calcium-binding protein 2-like n=1 Tax=Manis pentadactyla TaxID=143292 RepID=UPI00255D09DE|nr:calcium-binding protein 2-like [Manis pentadactyla]
MALSQCPEDGSLPMGDPSPSEGTPGPSQSPASPAATRRRALLQELEALMQAAYWQDRELRPEEIEGKEFGEEPQVWGGWRTRRSGEELTGHVPTEMELIAMSQRVSGGKVDFGDFVELMGPKLLAETADMIGVRELRDAFREVRSLGLEGRISLGELRAALKALLGEPLSPLEVDGRLHDIDLNGDRLSQLL